MEGLIAYQKGSRFVTKGHTLNDKGQKLIVENEYDAEELLRHLSVNREHLEILEGQLRDFRRDLATLSKLESVAKRIREDELRRARIDRQKASRIN